MINPFGLFWLLIKASLFSTTGTGNLPILHQDLIPIGWASEQNFVEALAIGQITPGPNGLWVISLGYLIYGMAGALMATVAIVLPSFVVLPVNMLYRRIGAHPATAGFIRGLSLAAAGLFFSVLMGILRSDGVDLRSVAIMLAALALGLTRRVPLLLILALAALAGLLLY